MKTKAAILHEQNKPLQIEEIDIPKLGEGQVLVKLSYSGVCRSQLNEIKGFRGKDPYLPHTLGHEGSGVVVDIGKKVSKVKPGDKVVLSWIKGIGMETPSFIYEFNDCKINSGAISTFLEYSVISENRLVKIDSEISMDEAALLGCAFLTGAGIVYNQMSIHDKSSIVIFGMGGIGLSALIATREREASLIIAVDVTDAKYSQCMDLGASHFIDASQIDPLQRILDLTNKKGVDYSIECAGKKSAMELAFQSLNCGGLCVLAGNLQKGDRISIDPFHLIQGKKMIGTWGGKSVPDQDIPHYVRLISEGRISLKKLITHVIQLENINHLFNEMEKGQVGRALIEF